MIVILTGWADDVLGGTGGSKQGVPHMGELPPLHTPQGPGVPRAFRPGFPRVDSSAT